MNHLRKLGLASFLFLGLGLVSGALPRSATGWTPQTAVIVAVICYAVGLILALIAFMQSRCGQSLDGMTKFLARARDHRRADLFPSGHDRVVGKKFLPSVDCVANALTDWTAS